MSMDAIVLMMVLLIAVAMYFWYITLPLYGLLIWWQFALAKRIRNRGGKSGVIRAMAVCQIAFLCLPPALYPFMPGRTHTNEPLGLNEKAAWAAHITVGLIVFSLAASLWAAIVSGIRTRRENHRTTGRTVPPEAAASGVQ